jgi:hypothetical protein
MQQNMGILFIFSCRLEKKVTMGERDVKTSLLIIRIGHLMQQSLTMLLKKRSVYITLQQMPTIHLARREGGMVLKVHLKQEIVLT